jgi:uncharacterized protein (UPF0264 family)
VLSLGKEEIMPRILISRSADDVKRLMAKGDHRDSRRAAWAAIDAGSAVIVEIQTVAERFRSWTKLADAIPKVDPHAKRILEMRLEAIARLKHASHHRQGYRMSRRTHTAHPRPVHALCLISGHEGQEIPGLVRHDRVVVDAEHMEQALGPATVTEILEIRRKIGEHVYISTNVSESPQIVRSPKTGAVDSRSTAALTATKVLAALGAGADVVKVGFAHLDEYKRDLPQDEVLRQMKLVRREIDRAVVERAVLMPLNRTATFPLIAVFFPEIGIDSHGESPLEIAEKGIRLAAKGGWQGVLLDTFEKHTGRRYSDFYDLDDTRRLVRLAHRNRLELWIAGSIALPEVEPLIRCKVDLICFGGAARHKTGQRQVIVHGRPDTTIKRPLVEELVQAFEHADPRPRGRR